MMFSDAHEQTLFLMASKKYLYKLRAYSGYICGLVLAQLIVSAMMLSGSAITGTNVNNLRITFHTYSSQIVIIFTVVWAVIVSILISSRQSKEASFSLPGNRLSDCLSDFAYIITGCLFGGITAALLGAALRLEIFLLFKDKVLAQGFYPAIRELGAIAAATFLYMLLLSAAGYLTGTLVRISRMFIFVIGAVLVSMLVNVRNASGSAPLGMLIWDFLFQEKSLAFFALIAAALSALIFSLCALISNRMEVRKQ